MAREKNCRESRKIVGKDWRERGYSCVTENLIRVPHIIASPDMAQHLTHGNLANICLNTMSIDLPALRVQQISMVWHA